MHHKFHDEAEWHVDDRDDLDSIISGNYKEMQKKFEEEFQGSSHGTRKQKKTIKNNDGSLFTGNIKQYKKPPKKWDFFILFIEYLCYIDYLF